MAQNQCRKASGKEIVNFSPIFSPENFAQKKI
jgi:hypothetical protein